MIEHRQSTRAGSTIHYWGPSVWNELPASIKAVEHLQQFKKRLKKNLLGWGMSTIVCVFFIYFYLLNIFFWRERLILMFILLNTVYLF